MMKKIYLLPLLLLTLFVRVNKVNADTSINLSYFYQDFSLNYDIYSNYSDVVSNLISTWNSQLSSDYPYYYIHVADQQNYFTITLVAFTTTEFRVAGQSISPNVNYSQTKRFSYSSLTDSYSSPTTPQNNVSTASMWYSTNFTPTYSGNSYTIVQIPSYSNINYDVSYPSFTLNIGDVIPTYMSLTNGQPQSDFTEVDLSNYEYIILSLKDYNTQPFNTTIYTQGSLCFTPVYNYGMTQKQEYFNGYQVQGCTDVYSSSTPVSVYIIQSDLDNHSVYYIKQQTNVPTVLNIPTSIFNITYITSANNNDPQVSIGGRSYPVIPFNDLTDTANKSTDEGYISGQVCSLGDINCQSSQSGMDISDLFVHPLELLQTLWSSITNVFTLITTFIGLLPLTLQAFLYTAFMLAIILGILKIIL